ncbi:hypothetical protein [Bacteroides sp. 224]|uniref:hypothetical protein n=1 Tax=Bacteroides sp. 224 TaxID=2302936 RepID=UPI0013D8E027|nr:hypothetical protein [Bacteroides sp. 224]NDV66883.1 hypothetical protein [Bacteroides sp. 224]
MKQTIIYTLFSLLLFSSCGNESEEQAVMPLEEVYMNISTRILDPSMTKVRIIVADELSGQILLNEYPVQPEESTGEYKLSVRTGQLNFYVILNEPITLTSQLSGIKHHSAISVLKLNGVDLPSEEPIDDSSEQTNLPAMGMVKALVRASGSIPGAGEASIDGGVSWSNTLNIDLQRLAAKVTLALRKKTLKQDMIIVNKVSLTHIPYYEYLLPKAYAALQFESPLVYNTAALSFTEDTEYYTKVFTDYIIPEYIPTDPANKEMALCVKVEAKYNQRNVVYYIPVRADLDVEDYSIKRNNHYLLKATLTTVGETTFVPEISYQVANWSDVIMESEFLEETAITFSRRWGNTAITDTDIHIGNNEYLEFYFTLSRPKGSTWAATLTNGIDFMFDETDGAVSSGIAREGYEYKIRIKPRRETQLNGIKTDFYITVNNGMGNVELNLPNQSVGTKSRYTIIQIPG